MVLKYINKILLTFFIAFIIILSEKYSVSADVSNNRNFSEYLENTNYNKTQNSSYEVIKLNDYMIPEGEEDEIITINPSSDNYNDIDNVTNEDTYDGMDNVTNESTYEQIDNTIDENNYDNTTNKSEESSLETDSTDTPENNIDSETSSTESNLETSTSSALPETTTTTSTSSETLTAKDETKTVTPSSNSLNKNTSNSSSGNSNTSEKSFDRFDLAVANFMIFLLLVAIILYKFSPKLKVFIKSITSNKDKDEV